MKEREEVLGGLFLKGLAFLIFILNRCTRNQIRLARRRDFQKHLYVRKEIKGRTQVITLVKFEELWL